MTLGTADVCRCGKLSRLDTFYSLFNSSRITTSDQSVVRRRKSRRAFHEKPFTDQQGANLLRRSALRLHNLDTACQSQSQDRESSQVDRADRVGKINEGVQPAPGSKKPSSANDQSANARDSVNGRNWGLHAERQDERKWEFVPLGGRKPPVSGDRLRVSGSREKQGQNAQGGKLGKSATESADGDVETRRGGAVSAEFETGPAVQISQDLEDGASFEPSGSGVQADVGRQATMGKPSNAEGVGLIQGPGSKQGLEGVGNRNGGDKSDDESEGQNVDELSVRDSSNDSEGRTQLAPAGKRANRRDWMSEVRDDASLEDGKSWGEAKRAKKEAAKRALEAIVAGLELQTQRSAGPFSGGLADGGLTSDGLDSGGSDTDASSNGGSRVAGDLSVDGLGTVGLGVDGSGVDELNGGGRTDARSGTGLDTGSERSAAGAPETSEVTPAVKPVQIATANRLGGLSSNGGADERVGKWEEASPSDLTWARSSTSVTRGAGNSAREPQEFARELRELDGFPIEAAGDAPDFGVLEPMTASQGGDRESQIAAEGVSQSRRGDSWQRRGDSWRQRNLSAQKVDRTIGFLMGVSLSHEHKVQRFYVERGLDGQDAEEAVSSAKPVIGDTELGQLLAPLVGRLNSLELNKVLKGLADRGNWRMAVGLLKWMEGQPQCQPNEWSYSTVLAVLGRRKRSLVAVSVFERMEWRGFRPNAYVYSAMISCYASVREYKDAVKTFGKMVAAGIEPNVVTWSALIDACAKGGAGIGTCLRLFKRMEDSFGRELDEQVYCILADAYAKLGDWKSVRTVIRAMEQKHIRRSVVTLNTLMDGMAIGDAPLASLIDVYKGMLREGGRPDSYTYSILVKACGLRDDLVALDWVYAEMHANPDWVNSSDKNRVKVYDTVLSMYARRGMASDALRIFQVVKGQGLEPGTVTYNLLVRALGENGQLADAEKMLGVMLRKGYPPNVYSYIALMEAYMKNGQLAKVEETFRRIDAAGLEPTVSVFNLLMQSYVSRGNLKQAGSVLEDIRKRGRHPNVTSYAIMIRAHAWAATSSAEHGSPKTDGQLAATSATPGMTSSTGDGFLAPFRVLELFDEMREREAVGVLPREARADVIRAMCRCGRLTSACEQLGEWVSLQGGGFDAASVGGEIVWACIERGEVQYVPAAVEKAVDAGWDLAPGDLPRFLGFLERAADGLPERVLGALHEAHTDGLLWAVRDVLESGGSNTREKQGEETEKVDGNGSGRNGTPTLETITTLLEDLGKDLKSIRENESTDGGAGNESPVDVPGASPGVADSSTSDEEQSEDFPEQRVELFGFDPGPSLPSTAELEEIFVGLGLSPQSEQRKPDSNRDLVRARFRKSPLEVLWPQRQRAMPWENGRRVEGYPQNRTAPNAETLTNEAPTRLNGNAMQQGFEKGLKATTTRNRKGDISVMGSGEISGGLSREADLNGGGSLQASYNASYAQLLARVEGQLSKEDLQSVHESLAALQLRFEKLQMEDVLD